MDSFISDYIERFRYLCVETHSVLDRLPDEALDWTPTDTMNSATVLITHMMGATRYWIGDVAYGEQSVRIRDNEFKAKGVGGEHLRESISACIAFIEQKLTTLTVADLAEERHADRLGRSFTIGWCLLHALEHTAIHVGHLHQLVELYEAGTST